MPITLDFEQNAVSEENRSNLEKTREENKMSYENQYRQYIRELEEVRMAESAVTKSKMLYS